MALPLPVERLWDELQSARAELLREAEGLSQRQADWKPSERDWSVGEIVDHLTLAEISTGKLTTKLLKELPAGAATFPHDLAEFAPVPSGPPGPAEAPPVVWPAHGKSIGELIATMLATRERSRQSIERLAQCDPRVLTFKHFRLGEMDLGQWWRLQASHDLAHLQQLREVKASPGFPRE
jgi:DinB superfamily